MTEKKPRNRSPTDSGSGSRTLDTHLSPGVLQHRRQENHFTDTEQLRPRNDKLLSLESALHTRGTGRAHPTEHQNRLRKHPRFNSCPARKVGTYLQTKNRRHPEDPHYRKGTGNSPHPLLLPSVQFGFVIDKGELKDGVPEWFLLTGAGWGHGVGLCQIGAAVMGEQGYTYDKILLHYYKGADIRRFY